MQEGTGRMNKNKSTAGHTIVEPENTKYREKTLKAPRGKVHRAVTKETIHPEDSGMVSLNCLQKQTIKVWGKGMFGWVMLSLPLTEPS